MSRYWPEHGDCTRCYGHGWYSELLGEPDGLGVQDYLEKYCDACPAGDKLRKWDAPPTEEQGDDK